MPPFRNKFLCNFWCGNYIISYWILQVNNNNNKDFFHPDSGAFWPSFIALSITLIVILVFGIFFECFRRALCCKGRWRYDRTSEMEPFATQHLRAVLTIEQTCSNTTAAIQRCSMKKLFWQILKISKENK